MQYGDECEGEEYYEDAECGAVEANGSRPTNLLIESRRQVSPKPVLRPLGKAIDDGILDSKNGALTRPSYDLRAKQRRTRG